MYNCYKLRCILFYAYFPCVVFYNICTVHGADLTHISLLVIQSLYSRVCDKWNLKLKGLKSRIGDLVQPMYLHTSCALCLHRHDTSSACSITLLQTEREWKALLLYRRDFGEGFAGSVGSYVFKASLLLLASPKSPMNRFGPSLCMCVQYTQCPILKS